MKIINTYKQFNESIYEDDELYVTDDRILEYYAENAMLNDDIDDYFNIKYEYYIEDALYNINELEYLINYNSKNTLFFYKYKDQINKEIFDTVLFNDNYEIEIKKKQASKFNI